MASTHTPPGNGTRGFFPQKGIRIHMRNSWKSHAEIPCDLSQEGNAVQNLQSVYPLFWTLGHINEIQLVQ